ncbi:unnamed protein product [Cuscuta campestris]|uniref:Uncharacterized protein n=1 Tax=Cuscuta campestris TaxID=132261 RepID=A0A484KIT7_9ASTE|nr:unnamed protein product [Cuscuta campestris]
MWAALSCSSEAGEEMFPAGKKPRRQDSRIIAAVLLEEKVEETDADDLQSPEEGEARTSWSCALKTNSVESKPNLGKPKP